MTPLPTAAPVRPAASANGTVSPSDMPITTSRTASEARKWNSEWAALAILGSLDGSQIDGGVRGAQAIHGIAGRMNLPASRKVTAIAFLALAACASHQAPPDQLAPAAATIHWKA